VITLCCTERLRRLLRVSLSRDEPATDSTLGDWYANLLTTRPKHLAICVNERSLLVVVVPLAPYSTFLARFRAAAAARLQQIPAPAPALQVELEALGTVQIGRTRSRSVLGSLKELRFLGQVHLDAEPRCDPETLALFLCHTPMFALTTHWPWLEATTLLGGDLAQARRTLLDAT